MSTGRCAEASDGYKGQDGNGGRLKAMATFATDRPFTIGENGGGIDVVEQNTLTAEGVFGGSGSIYKKGLGTLELRNSSNSYSGGTFLNEGTLRLASESAAGSGFISTAEGTALELLINNDSTMVNSIEGKGTIVKSGGGELALLADHVESESLSVDEGALDIRNVLSTSAINTLSGTRLHVGILSLSGARQLALNN